MPNVDWAAIRPLNGSRATGFEELCAQLARAEAPAGSSFERKGTPDAGVECYAILSDKTEWGWQSKYFDSLGDSQWSQMDESVGTALEKHGQLVRYFVCIPLDRPDARIEDRRSAKNRWDNHVAKWSGWARARGMSVEFVYWGSHELLERLSDPKHVGRLRFWFDIRGFDKAWLNARLEEALKTAGPRYTPEIHVELPVAGVFESFGRTEVCFDRIKACARKIRERAGTFRYPEGHGLDARIQALDQPLSSTIARILAALTQIAVQPIGQLPLKQIVDEIEAAIAKIRKLDDRLSELAVEYDRLPHLSRTNTSYATRTNPFRAHQTQLERLGSELRLCHRLLSETTSYADAVTLLVRGAAGTGKTHLLCDVARQRIAAGRPTVLLMGQRFIGLDDPWRQALQQLDLAELSAEEFVGALESAAAAAGCRALIIIDAINEGAGRRIWPNQLAAFLAHIERSPWIGTVISVRTSYEELVIPEDVRTRAVAVTHRGFADHEYDATRTFFNHYGLELPSTPVLSPEFRNPLFLKTLCRGLNAQGAHRLPRGFHGISAVFDLYIDAINKRLSETLEFNSKTPLVSGAVQALARLLAASGNRWLPLTEAETAVNGLLPGRTFENSLYRGLVVEGILAEENVPREDGGREDVVFIGYERLADHLIAKLLLEQHFNSESPASAFEAGAPLAFLWDQKHYTSPGLLEAMCIQVPERSGHELTALAPQLIESPWTGDAFRQSLVWRAQTAFSGTTVTEIDRFNRSDHDLWDTLESLLTVATLPGHPLNANFLDQRLHACSMPDRDSLWSTYLHHAWKTHGAVDRLVDWASSIRPADAVDSETAELCSIVLMWIFSTANRFLRDRATIAAVTLLSGRSRILERLLDRFAHVDDMYIAERVYAVSYGVAMRSNDGAQVNGIAKKVYEKVFASGLPPSHILLRDYARGVIERALALGTTDQFNEKLFRPPYTSAWPKIPTKDQIKPLLADWTRGSHDSGELEWARNRISSSVMDDDFARYVIGTNSSHTSWLSIRLDEPPWRSPHERLAALRRQFSSEEEAAWVQYEERSIQVTRLSWSIRLTQSEDGDANQHSDLNNDAGAEAVARANEAKETAQHHLLTVLNPEHRGEMLDILKAKESDGERPPRFDLELIQRYVLWRVFELGWTTERFGRFDRYAIGYHGRAASKPERIGKKYQWIAYHEISAMISDRFQYRSWLSDDKPARYDGPWQDHLRDVDPSCAVRAVRGGTPWDGHQPAWWAPSGFDNWDNPKDAQKWAFEYGDIPRLEDLLVVTQAPEGKKWVNAQGYFHWKDRPPNDREAADGERKEVWIICTGHILPLDGVDSFLAWAETVNFWGRWMPEPPEVYKMFLGEHAWSPASGYFERAYHRDARIDPVRGCPVAVSPAAFEYLKESSGFDCSIDEGFTLRLPGVQLVKGLRLLWTGNAADFTDGQGEVTAFDPTAHSAGPSALLVRDEPLRTFLAREGLALCWTVIGEKRLMAPGLTPAYSHSLELSGSYALTDKGAVGFLKCFAEDRTGTADERLIAVLRT